MPESRGESFYGGRFFERTFGRDHFEASDNPTDGWDYEAAFRASDHDDAPAAYVASTYSPDRYPEHSEEIWKHGDNFLYPTYQGTLFSTRPEKHEIDGAFSTKDARHHIPTLLGMAAQHSLKTRGKLPEASGDLSPQSSKMVQRAVDLGLVKNPSGGDTVHSENRIGWDEGEYSARWRSNDVRWSGDEVPFERVNAGRQFVRDVLRRPKKYRAEQLTID